ncbi:vacuolar protein sorting-associated protein 37D-like [Denticeps clupeoides]|uniref:vacuolar protein sorting-associated protein 37D-like n=1 Tax=Denticeps clupeoides TaxID=299321 RepID=UPI0010A3C282|nr:vacuolar protein sorting-associated protein 37D-like [Denticeps clupeoides]XP_028855584.1 vacuolar protein sorting-associated protein 37D-like [Denticeps clupeoides]
MQEKTTCRVVFCNRSHSAAGFIGRATFSVWSHNSHRRRNGIRLDRRCGELEVDMSMGRDLWHLSAAELWDLLEDPGRTDRMVRVSVKFQALQRQKVFLLDSNQKLALQNLSLQPRLDSSRLRLADRYLRLTRAARSVRDKRALLATLQRRYRWTPQTTQQGLREHAELAMDQSEELLQKFMEGLLPLEWFVEPFLSCRKVYHVRQVQADKLQELLTPPEMPRDHHRLHRPPRSLSLYPNILPAITPPVVHCCFTTYLLKGPYLPPLDPHCQDQRPSPPQNALTTRRLYSHPSKNHQLFRHRR